MNLEVFSSNSLLISFFLYLISFFGFVWSIVGKGSLTKAANHTERWNRIGFGFGLAAWLAHVTFFLTRWAAAGHIPTSNMFEFMTFLAMMIGFTMLAFYLYSRNAILGAFSTPLAAIIIAFASVFPRDVEPLIPALQSYWLKIHVTTAAFGESFFAIGFAAGLMYLLRTTDYSAKDARSARAKRWLEVVLSVVMSIIVFCVLVFSFKATGVTYIFQNADASKEAVYVLPPLVGPNPSELTLSEASPNSWNGVHVPLVQAPSFMKGKDAARKFNTVIWTTVITALVYGLLRLTVARRGLGAVLSRMTTGLDPEDLDELSYRTIAIGYPIFALGGLLFAMIWAKEAWGRFWDNDPKEVWAAIVFLFYTAYLHLRLSRGWLGAKSAWLTVIGFLIVMFTLVGVNLVISGLHSYAGV